MVLTRGCIAGKGILQHSIFFIPVHQHKKYANAHKARRNTPDKHTHKPVEAMSTFPSHLNFGPPCPFKPRPSTPDCQCCKNASGQYPSTRACVWHPFSCGHGNTHLHTAIHGSPWCGWQNLCSKYRLHPVFQNGTSMIACLCPLAMTSRRSPPAAPTYCACPPAVPACRDRPTCRACRAHLP